MSGAHLDDIGPALLLGGDGGDSDGFAQALDEVVRQAVDLLEVRVQLRSHVVVGTVEIRPDGLGGADRRGAAEGPARQTAGGAGGERQAERAMVGESSCQAGQVHLGAWCCARVLPPAAVTFNPAACVG